MPKHPSRPEPRAGRAPPGDAALAASRARAWPSAGPAAAAATRSSCRNVGSSSARWNLPPPPGQLGQEVVVGRLPDHFGVVLVDQEPRRRLAADLLAVHVLAPPRTTSRYSPGSSVFQKVPRSSSCSRACRHGRSRVRSGPVTVTSNCASLSSMPPLPRRPTLKPSLPPAAQPAGVGLDPDAALGLVLLAPARARAASRSGRAARMPSGVRPASRQVVSPPKASARPLAVACARRAAAGLGRRPRQHRRPRLRLAQPGHAVEPRQPAPQRLVVRLRCRPGAGRSGAGPPRVGTICTGPSTWPTASSSTGSSLATSVPLQSLLPNDS